MYLVDTNIFLEILLQQERAEECKAFLAGNIDNLHISDFTLHSIGVILFRQKAEVIFQQFLEDVLPFVTVISLPNHAYKNLIEARNTFKLDFDDAYQFCICQTEDLTLISMDQDFRNVEGINVRFL